MKSKTKIIATIGPASSNLKVVLQMIKNGLNVARINFSHGDHKTHKKSISTIRQAEKIAKIPVAILADMGGPKIRTGKFKNGASIMLRGGDNITFAPEEESSACEIPITYKELAKDVKTGDILLLDDGKISVNVRSVSGAKIAARVVCGGELKEHKGINLPDIALSASAITRKDVNDMRFALKMKVDYIGLSFVQDATDILHARKLMRRFKTRVPIVAKIERKTALKNLKSIISEADAVMVARGDLGVETPLESVPIVQKRIIMMAHKLRKPVIVATQMLESMIKLDRPTRAEASDVANSVLDGADAIMLSAETAMGHNPPLVIETMAKIADAAEESRYFPQSSFELDSQDDTVSMSTSRAACFAAEEVKASLICVFTMTGKSALYISKQRPSVKTIAITNNNSTLRRLNLLFGIHPLKIPSWRSIDLMIKDGIRVLRSAGLAMRGEKIVTVCGTTTTPGATNMIKILEV